MFFFPELTSERRIALLKVAKDKMEEIKAHVRSARDDVWQDIQQKEKNKEMSEDEKFRAKDDMQKRVDDTNKKLDEALLRKEKEISG